MMADEVTLTELIESLLDWQEKMYLDIFKYGQVDFRGAFARYYYFSAVNNPSALLPLLMSSKGWELENKNSTLLALHQEILRGANLKVKPIQYLRNGLALAKITFIKLASFFIRHEKPLNKNGEKTIGFFALNSRFVVFFKEIIANLKDYQPTVFTPDINTTSESIIKVGGRGQKLFLGDVFLRQMHISVFHPLFSSYVSILHFYVLIFGGLKYNQPLVLVFAEGTSMQDEVASQAAKSLLIPTVRIQSGRGGVMHCGYRNMSYDKMLCWGVGFVKHYKKYSSRPVYEVTGSPLFTGLEAKDGVGIFSLAIFTQPISKHISEKEYAALINVCIAVVQKIPEAKIIIRKHPVDASNAFDDLSLQYPEHVKLMPSTEYTLTEVMNKVECAIGFYSTTLSEASACDVIPIVMKLREQHSVFPFPEKCGAAIIAESEKATFDIIHDIMINPGKFTEIRKNMKAFSVEFFGENDGKSMQRITENIILSAKPQ